MIYSTTAKYAVMALINLASRPGRTAQIKEISEATGIPSHYLGKIVQALVKSGVLTSSKGRGGGVGFSKDPSKLNISTIVRIIDGEKALLNCIFGLQLCDGTRNCPLHGIWGPIRKQVIDFLDETTIADLSRASLEERH